VVVVVVKNKMVVLAVKVALEAVVMARLILLV
jgi:hypothetical protein